MNTFLKQVRIALLAERHQAGHWTGELSRSALSTATAVIALHLTDANEHAALIAQAKQWLRDNQNRDGGWGDTTLSQSNISTTLLAWSALGLGDEPDDASSRRASDWIQRKVGTLDPDEIKAVVSARYGKDRTFSVPILMACALCGKLGKTPQEAWRRVPPLPFELAVFPRRWYGALQLPVVSYALPALIAIGYARHFHGRSFFVIRIIRSLAWKAVSRLLSEIQPASGGYLEATPLTSFVVMALAGTDQKNHPVVSPGIDFLLASVRDDGSWPIDTNLATWVTTLATKALLTSDQTPADFPQADQERVLKWLLQQQYHTVHPFTLSAPGGWAWTDLSGGVPDADDTAGALLAIRQLAGDKPEVIRAANAGITWLLNLQNRDGGIPTFCRGWGRLPFDRSSPDISAHALRAMVAWKTQLDSPTQKRVTKAIDRLLRYLEIHQAADGSWSPLWFGNEHLEGENNLTYGTAQVILALSAEGSARSAEMLHKAVAWLVSTQSPNGGWSGGDPDQPTSIEETALAIKALANAGMLKPAKQGLEHLKQLTANGTRFPDAPIGFYFAKLWYGEKLYPLVWTVEALESFTSALAKREATSESKRPDGPA